MAILLYEGRHACVAALKSDESLLICRNPQMCPEPEVTVIVSCVRGSHSKQGSMPMHNKSFRTARRAGVAAALLMGSCGLALAGPGGGGFHGGGFHGGGFNQGGFGSMHSSGFGHSSFGHSSGGFRHSSGMSRTAMHHSGPVGHHGVPQSSHHSHLASNGTPKGFSHGNASWKQT